MFVIRSELGGGASEGLVHQEEQNKQNGMLNAENN